jgi:predicted dehydrogenase
VTTDRPVGVGFIGTGLIARAHAHALRTLWHMVPGAPATRLVSVAGRDPARTEAAARDWGFDRGVTDWRAVVEDPEVDLVANLAATDVHAEPVLRALELGKSVLCEKPLAPTSAEAESMRDAAAKAGVVAVCGYNYRFVPALRLARHMIASGALGEMRQFRGCYLQDWANTARSGWRFQDPVAGSTLGDLSHTIDLLSWLVGPPREVVGVTSAVGQDGGAMRHDHAGVPDDAFSAVLLLDGGVTATIDGSRVATGWKGRNAVEVVGSAGSLWWDMEDLNRLHVFLAEPAGSLTPGFRNVLVTEDDHPYLEHWWPTGHALGWEHTFAHQWLDTLRAHAGGAAPDQDLPTFDDGVRATQAVDAVRRSAATRGWMTVA